MTRLDGVHLKPTIRLLLAACLMLGVACSEPPPEDATRAEVQDVYTCSMHPHVVQHEAGTCPICGMTLSRRSAPPAGSGAEPSGLAGPNDEGEGEILYWVAPMDPTYVRDGPGKSPMGMDLVPVRAKGTTASQVGALRIDPVVVQRMGVRTRRAVREPLFRHLRTLGRVEVSEQRVSVVNLRFSGWITEIHVDATGESVDAGDPLFAIYSPDLVAAQEEYLLALRAQGAKSALARSARRKLELFDLPADDVAAIARSGQVRRNVVIRAPRTGHVLHKNVVEGAYIAAGSDLYTIADLSHVWVQAEVYESDAPWVQVGQSARMELAYQSGRDIEGTVAFVYPTLNEASRTLTVRLEFPNPDLRLKPGMFATVYIQFQRVEDALVIPTEAILHSGRRNLVFVDMGEGRFQPREIETGLVGDRHMTQVLAGLQEGDVVVTSGQFLLDSESQLQEAIEKMLSPRNGERGALSSIESEPPTVYACPMHPDQTADAPGRCPICGMDLEVSAAESGTAPEAAP